MKRKTRRERENEKKWHWKKKRRKYNKNQLPVSLHVSHSKHILFWFYFFVSSFKLMCAIGMLYVLWKLETHSPFQLFTSNLESIIKYTQDTLFDLYLFEANNWINFTFAFALPMWKCFWHNISVERCYFSYKDLGDDIHYHFPIHTYQIFSKIKQLMIFHWKL